MRKKLLSVLLALCMALALLPAAFAAVSGSAGYSDSGSTAMKKLTRLEIAQLLKDNPLTLPANVFETEPSYAAPYAPGKVRQEALQAALNRLNALRRIAGLPSVELDSDWCDSAQYGAVLLSVSEFSHYPAKPADMDDSFYSLGRSATSTSNIAGGYSLTRAVDGFMDDSDAGNVSVVGHRRWQLNPRADKVGFGYAAHGSYRYYVDEKVIGSSNGSCDYEFIAWPASGSFPNTLFSTYMAWSVTVDPNRYQTPSRSDVAVTLTRQSDGKSWTFSGSESYTAAGSGKYFNVDTSGAGVSNCIIFRPDDVGGSYEGVYTVTITGLKTRSGEAAAISYQVDFFDPEHPLPFTDVSLNDWYAEPVDWAVANNIAVGKGGGIFDPVGDCTQVQILTFLWRAEGRPASSVQAPIKGDNQDYQDAMNWAYGKGMIGSSFDPNALCKRSDAVTYIWQAQGSKDAPAGSYTDVTGGESYAAAVNWAAANGVVMGYPDGSFQPDTVCSRGHIVTFLHRAYVSAA